MNDLVDLERLDTDGLIQWVKTLGLPSNVQNYITEVCGDEFIDGASLVSFYKSGGLREVLHNKWNIRIQLGGLS